MVEVTQEDRILLTEIVRRLDRESYDKDALEHVRRMLARRRAAAEQRGHLAGMREAAGIADRMICFDQRDPEAILLSIRQRATAIETGADHDR